MSIRLDLINSMLATTGVAKLSAADSTHPSYIVADAVLSEVIEEFSSKELWFNTTIRTLAPNTDKYVLVPTNALSCDPVDTGTKVQLYQQKAAQKDMALVTLNMKHTDANFFNGKAYASFSTRRSATHSTVTRIQ